ncbi:MAG: hypothetical protein ABII90_11420 [Bacteroidota bacterium]
MNHSFKVGLSFGITSGVITTLGLMIGLYAGTHSKLVVLGGVLTIAIADSLSDAMGIHISEESENVHTHKEIWISTISTFFSKLICAISFIIPLIFFSLDIATIISVIWGLLLLGIFSYYIAVEQKTKPFKVITEHLLLALLVIVLTYFVGNSINSIFC